MDQQKRWEDNPDEFNAAFRTVMRRRSSLVNIPATLRNWIAGFKQVSPALHKRAAEQVAEWMRENRHLFPKLRIK